jgi:hypothetical protein
LLTTEGQWLSCTDPAAMIDTLRAAGKFTERKARLLVVAVCRRIWPLLTDGRSRKAVEVSEQFADGLADRGARSTARRASSRATSVAWRALQRSRKEGLPEVRDKAPPFEAASAATYALDANLDVKAIAWRAARAIDVTDEGGWPAGEGETASSEEKRGQADLLRDIFGNPFREVRFDLAWLTPSVLSIARRAYDERDFAALPVLADALADAGCDNEDLLRHCREPGLAHCRGCWVVDLILGKG